MTTLALPRFSARGLCVDAGDPELWQRPDAASVTVAKGICRACPIRDECAAWGLTHKEESGVWGGLTETDRRGCDRASRAGYRAHLARGEQSCAGCLRAKREYDLARREKKAAAS